MGPAPRNPDNQFPGSETGAERVTSWTGGRRTTPCWEICRRRSGRLSDTRDSGFGTGRTYGTGLTRESGVPDALRRRGDCGWTFPRPGRERMIGPKCGGWDSVTRYWKCSRCDHQPGKCSRYSVARSCRRLRQQSGIEML